MNLGSRLEAVAQLAGTGSYERGADIGTDHAKLAIELVKRGICKKVIASDKHTGPCEAARRTVLGESLSDVIEVRQGDGLASLSSGEAELIIIAGMGGKLMLNILTEGRAVLVNNPRLVLQPQTDLIEVRRSLCKEGWQIADESLAEENGHFYVALAFEKADRFLYSPTEKQLITGVYLKKKMPTLWMKYAEGNIARLRRAVAGMEQGKNAGGSPEYIRQKWELTVWEKSI